MLKSISIEKMFNQHSFYDRFPLVKKAGFDHLEFCLWSHLDIVRIKELIDEYSLHIACISGDEEYSITVPEERSRFLEHLEKSLATAKELRCGNLYIHSNAIGQNGAMSAKGLDYSNHTRIAAATRALLEGARLAEKYGIVLQLEPVSTHVLPNYYMDTTASAGDVVRVIDSPNVRLLYDVYHMQMTEGNITHTLRRYGQIVGYVHIADVPARHEPGTGEINFIHFKSVLDEIGYKGFVGFELTPSGDMDACVQALHDF